MCHLEADVLEHGGGVIVGGHLVVYQRRHTVHQGRTLHRGRLTRGRRGRLGGEQHAALLHVGSRAALLRVGGRAGDAHLEDADAVELDLLTQLQVVLEGAAQLVEYGDAV